MNKLHYFKLGHYSLHELDGGEYVATLMWNSELPTSFLLKESELVKDNRSAEADPTFFKLLAHLEANTELEEDRRVIPSICSLFTPELTKGDELTNYFVGVKNWRQNKDNS